MRQIIKLAGQRRLFFYEPFQVSGQPERVWVFPENAPA
jgi:hypothetical protein